MHGIHQITPFLHVPDLPEAVRFFCDALTFELKFRQAGYAYVELAGCGLRLLEEPDRRLQADGKARVTVYIDVEDVDAMYARLRTALAQLTPDRLQPPRTMPWGQREFQVRMPDDDWLSFGTRA